MTTPELPPLARILGTGVHPLTNPALVDLILAWAQAPGPARVVANHNLHSLALWHHHPDLQAFYAEADAIHADGMAIVAWAALKDVRFGRQHRTGYLDWFEPFLDRAAASHLRLFWVGSPDDHLVKILGTLRTRWPGLIIEGHHGYFGPEDEPGLMATITAFAPDLVVVGMGMPRQERWIARWRHHLPRGVFLPCGAAGEYLAGFHPRAPRWLGQIGLEWAWRLACDPRRLAHRYLIEPLSLLGPALRDFGTRR